MCLSSVASAAIADAANTAVIRWCEMGIQLKLTQVIE